MQEEKDIILNGIFSPSFKLKLEETGCSCSEGKNYKEDLSILQSYIKRKTSINRGRWGADALLEFGYKPNIIVGIWIV